MDTLLGIILSPYFWFMLAVIIACAGALGFFLPLKALGTDFLDSRRFFRTMLILFVVGHFLFTMYQPTEEFDPQSLLAEEGKDWLTFWGNILFAYFAAWAFVSGMEKRRHNPFIFFNREFYQKIEKPAKKK
jgi:hypothetical protein